MDATYPTKRVRSIIIQHQARTAFQRQMSVSQYHGIHGGDGNVPAPPGCAKEQAAFRSTGALFGSVSILKAKEPILLRLVQDKLQRGAGSTRIEQYLDENWRPNPTFVDSEWQKVRDDLLKDPNFSHDPFEMEPHFFEESEIEPPKAPSSLFDYASAFFRPVARAFDELKDRMTVELFYGEMSDMMERLRYGILDQRNALQATLPANVPKYPVRFHRIHMSNIP
jgi:hypothetical protein